MLLLVLISAIYFSQAITLAERAPLWMDEVLAVWTGRLPSVAAVWSALTRGSEFSPPLYDLLLHGLAQLGFTTPLAMRMPSIIAIYVAAVAVGLLVYRRLGLVQAGLAAAVFLSTGVYAYAVQARPYACVTAALSWAVFALDGMERPSARRQVSLAVLLAVAIAMNFYALLFAPLLVAIEMVRARVEQRKPHVPTLLAITAGAVTILFWWPILHAASSYSRADVWAPAYYGKPTLPRLSYSYQVILGWLAGPLILLAAAAMLFRVRPIRAPALEIPALGLFMLPGIVFAFALVVSHSFADRYTIGAGLGIALMFAWLVHQFGEWANRVALMLTAFLSLGGMLRNGGEIANPGRLGALALLRSAPGNLPIATGDGLRYFEAIANSPTAISSRVIFLDAIGAAGADPTNRNQVMRWKAIAPDLHVANATDFLCRTPAFLLFRDPLHVGDDPLPAWLEGQTRFRPPPTDRASLILVHALPCNNHPKTIQVSPM